VVLFHLALLVGAICLVLSLLRMGAVVHFVPESALLGFTVGAAVLIAFGQLHHLLGVPGSKRPEFVLKVAEVLGRAGSANWCALGIGALTLAIMVAFQKYARRLPLALLAIVAATLAARALRPWWPVALVRDIAPVPGGLPLLHWQMLRWDLMKQLMPAAAMIAVVGLIEAISIAQTLG